jgi:hypothetical protein
MSVLVKPGNPQNLFQVIPIVITVLAFFPFTGTDSITLFPGADRMRLYIRKILNITYAEKVHIDCNKRGKCSTNITEVLKACKSF